MISEKRINSDQRVCTGSHSRRYWTSAPSKLGQTPLPSCHSIASSAGSSGQNLVEGQRLTAIPRRIRGLRVTCMARFPLTASKPRFKNIMGSYQPGPRGMARSTVHSHSQTQQSARPHTHRAVVCPMTGRLGHPGTHLTELYKVIPNSLGGTQRKPFQAKTISLSPVILLECRRVVLGQVRWPFSLLLSSSTVQPPAFPRNH